MTDFPKVSVIVATRNRADYLKKMLDRLFADGYPNLETIVIDGASDDGTVALLKSYGKNISCWVSEADRGEFDADNKGLGRATGEFVKIMTDDDVLRPGSLHAAVGFFESHPDVDIVFGQAAVWRCAKGETKLQFVTRLKDASLLAGPCWVGRRIGAPLSQAALIRRTVFERIGGFSTDYVAGDWEFWMRAARRGVRMALIDDIVLDYYYHADSTSCRRPWRMKYDTLRIYWKHATFADAAWYLWRAIVVGEMLRYLAGIIYRFSPRALQALLNLRPRRADIQEDESCASERSSPA